MGGFKALKTKDLVNIGIYTALYFVCMGLAEGLTTLVTGLVLPGYASILVPCMVGLFAGPVYMLLCQKVPKFGAISILGTVMGLFFLVSGHFALSFFPYIICGVLADLLQTVVGKSRSTPMLYLSYLVLTFGATGPVLPLWFMKGAYVASLQKRGKDGTYINNLFAHIDSITLLALLVFTLAGGLIGAYIGKRLVDKHFKPAAGPQAGQAVQTTTAAAPAAGAGSQGLPAPQSQAGTDE
ncbi:ABC transporter permease [Bifidobacterium aemilianum]|uniref:ABC transporter permease n=1 Tax=Bifidobacterium aemilianum TaxID=2493120 RepID=A0A366K9F1_9BIFI|nr:MptD family putative ECF transporter S component [Bifidobacterium aemilianum]RBP97957.1 ABC transporter permease [Bifidobacterium aemilianum]